MGSVIFKRPPIKKLAKEGMFGIDMHFHTRYSMDAISKINSCVKKAEKKGFGFAITDHNTVRGVMASYRLRKHATIIPGIEVTCKNGNHVLLYFYRHRQLEEFFNKELKPRMVKSPYFADVSLNQLVDLTKDYNCLMGAPHPFGVGAVGMMHTGITKKVERALDIVEVINGYNFRRSNVKAAYWAGKIDKAMTGGSDGHSTYELGRVLTFTHEKEDINAIFKEILKNKSMVIGKEDGIFLKTVMGLRKEGAYVRRSSKQHMARSLLRNQLGTEYKYLKEKLKNGRAYHFLAHHKDHTLEPKE